MKLCSDVLVGLSVSGFVSGASIGHSKGRVWDWLIAMYYVLHPCGVVHGDIKCENALVFSNDEANVENWQAKIADFGHAIVDLEYVTD